MRSKMFLGFFLFILGVTGLPAPALAAFVGGSKPLPFHMWPKGQMENGITLISVQEARLRTDETPVIVRGNIIQYVGKDQYVFEDESSSILVAIPPDRWGELENITPANLVELHGKLLKYPTYVKINVAKIVKVQ